MTYLDVIPNIKKRMHSKISGKLESFIIYGQTISGAGVVYHAYYIAENGIKRHEAHSKIEVGKL